MARVADMFRLHNYKTIPSEALSKNRPHPFENKGPRIFGYRITVEVCGSRGSSNPVSKEVW